MLASSRHFSVANCCSLATSPRDWALMSFSLGDCIHSVVPFALLSLFSCYSRPAYTPSSRRLSNYILAWPAILLFSTISSSDSYFVAFISIGSVDAIVIVTLFGRRSCLKAFNLTSFCLDWVFLSLMLALLALTISRSLAFSAS